MYGVVEMEQKKRNQQHRPMYPISMRFELIICHTRFNKLTITKPSRCQLHLTFGAVV